MKFNSFLKKGLFSLTFLLSFAIFSQQTVIDANVLANYNHGLKLYNNKAYSSAQKIFFEVSDHATPSSNLAADASYYIAMCAIKLNQNDADKKVLQFVDDYPNSTKKNKAYFNVGNYYFSNQKTAYALKWYKKVNVDIISDKNRKELTFKMAYSLLTTKHLKLAGTKFLSLINDAKYGDDSRYYYGYIAYKLENYGLAESTLKEIADSKSYEVEISYYLLDISFKAGKFERSIDVGMRLLKEARTKERSEISKIIGESYFNLKKYEKAIPYLKAYKGKRRKKWSNTDYYQLGYSFFKLKDYTNAINNFNKIIGIKNAVSQNAYYHLGICYLNLDKKIEALNAFQAASTMGFSQSIKEDSALNYAKLSYEKGNPFKSVPEVLKTYLRNYPKSKYYSEINELLITSYIHQQDYQGALDFLAAKKSPENDALQLEVSLYRGIQLFNENQLHKALVLFENSSQSKTLEINEKAAYWEAETNFRLENYEKSLAQYIALKKQLKNSTGEPFSRIDYNIGYTYFKLLEYQNAGVSFTQFLSKNIDDTVLKDDALVRLGDSYFATKQYIKSIEFYNKVTENKGSGADYAQYQIGMSYGFTGENNKKIEELKTMVNSYKNSSLKDDALYQIAVTYTSLKEHQNAHTAYNQLINKHPKSVFLPKALVRKGLLFYTDNQPQKALENFKKTVTLFPNSPEALESVANARNIYIDNGKIDDYVAWTNTIDFVNVSNIDIDNTTFSSAEKKYFEATKPKNALKSLVNYVKKFPEGIHKLKATFYLGETRFKVGKFDNAIENYSIVLAQEQNEYSEESLSKLSQIYLTKNNFTSAMPLLKRLEQEAYQPENILFSQSNLMKGYYEAKDYKLALEYAQKVLKKDKLAVEISLDAKKIIARISFENSDFKNAEKYFSEVEKEAVGVLKAEALYYSAYFKNYQEKYLESNEVVQKLIADYSKHKYWGVKSYVVMAKNYHGLKDIYQATFVLENIIKNFKQYDGIIIEAEKELKNIKEKEAKTNNSVLPEEGKSTKKETKN